MPSFIIKLVLVGTILASANGATIEVPTDQPTIKVAVTAANAGDTIKVSDGTYNENIVIDKTLSLLSVNGREKTTIEGKSASGGPLGTIVVTSNVHGVQIGNSDKGFKIVGIDNGSPGIENAAVYFQGGHNGAVIKDNEIVANGDCGLLTEYNAVNKGFVVDGNEFSGATFFDPPAGWGFMGNGGQSDQFTLPNVPRQLVVIQTGSSNVTFVNNIVSGTAGGINSSGQEQGNTLVTIDSNIATIKNNIFSGISSRYATQLRARGPNTLIQGNTFDSSGLYTFPLKATGQVYIKATNYLLSVVANSNTFDRGVYVDGTDATIGLSIKFFVSAVNALPTSTPALTINVLPGCYVEIPHITVEKNMNLVGGGRDSTTISPGGDTGNSGDLRGWFLVQEGKNMNVSGITFDGTNCMDTALTYKIWQAYRHKGSGTFEDVTFKNIQYDASGPSYSGVAIAAFGTNSNVNVLGSDFSKIGRVGVLYFGNSVTGTFEGNTYTGKGDGNFLNYALDISAGANIVVKNNVIKDNRGVAASDNSTSTCLLVTTFIGPGTTAEITDNNLVNSMSGVAIGYNASDTSHVELTGNTLAWNNYALKFTGPGITGFANRNAIVDNYVEGMAGVAFILAFDATCNWWNDPFGPSGEGPGLGNSVSGNVDFEPWLLTEDLVDGECIGGSMPKSLQEQARIFLSSQSGVKGIEKAIVSIENSLEPSLWTDDSTLNVANGKTVFNEECNAVVMLSTPSVEVISGISQVIDALVLADKSLAQKAINDATNTADIAKANEFVAKANTATTNGNPVNAINMYRQAWMSATRATRRL